MPGLADGILDDCVLISSGGTEDELRVQQPTHANDGNRLSLTTCGISRHLVTAAGPRGHGRCFDNSILHSLGKQQVELQGRCKSEGACVLVGRCGFLPVGKLKDIRH